MKSHEIMNGLRELRKLYKNQNFKFTREQQIRYANLIAQRRGRVNYFYANDMVA